MVVGLRRFLPESWTGDPERLTWTPLPEDRWAPRAKPEITLEEIDGIRAAGVPFGCVLADAAGAPSTGLPLGVAASGCAGL